MNRGRPKQFDESEALVAAMDVFWASGFEDTSCEELMAAMGINAGSMYATFGDKRSLYESAFKNYCDQSKAQVMQVLNSDESPLECVRNFVGCWMNMDLKGCMIANTLIEFGKDKSGIGKQARSINDGLRKALEKKLAAAQSAGELSKDVNASETAAFLVNTVQGLSISTRAGVSKGIRQGVVNTALGLLK